MLDAFMSFFSHVFETTIAFVGNLTAPLFSSNELTFITHSVLIATFAVVGVRLGRGALTGFIAVCCVLGNLFVIKEATIFGLEVVTSDGFTIGANIAVTLIHRYYGDKAAKNSILIGAYCAFFFLLMTQIHLLYVPNIHDTMHPFFYAILERMPRIILTSFFVALMSFNLNLYLFDKITHLVGERFSNIASFFSMSISQFFDTTLFAICALYGTVHSVTQVIFFSSLVKCLSIAIAVLVVSLCQNFIKKPTEL